MCSGQGLQWLASSAVLASAGTWGQGCWQPAGPGCHCLARRYPGSPVRVVATWHRVGGVVPATGSHPLTIRSSRTRFVAANVAIRACHICLHYACRLNSGVRRCKSGLLLMACKSLLHAGVARTHSAGWPAECAAAGSRRHAHRDGRGPAIRCHALPPAWLWPATVAVAVPG